jgi:hypothetical protein
MKDMSFLLEYDILKKILKVSSVEPLVDGHNSNCITLLRAMHESNSDVLTCSYEAVDEISSGSAESWQFDFARLKLLTRTFLLQISLEKVDLVLFTR